MGLKQCTCFKIWCLTNSSSYFYRLMRPELRLRTLNSSCHKPTCRGRRLYAPWKTTTTTLSMLLWWDITKPFPVVVKWFGVFIQSAILNGLIKSVNVYWKLFSDDWYSDFRSSEYTEANISVLRREKLFNLWVKKYLETKANKRVFFWFPLQELTM